MFVGVSMYMYAGAAPWCLLVCRCTCVLVLPPGGDRGGRREAESRQQDPEGAMQSAGDPEPPGPGRAAATADED